MKLFVIGLLAAGLVLAAPPKEAAVTLAVTGMT